MEKLSKYFKEEDFKILKSFGEEVEFKKGKVIIEEKQKKYEFYYILDGEVKVYTEKLGEEIIIAKLSKGDFIGEIAFFLKGLRTANVKAETDVKMIKFTEKTFKNLEEENPETAIKIYKALIENLGEKLSKANLELETYNILYKAATE